MEWNPPDFELWNLVTHPTQSIAKWTPLTQSLNLHLAVHWKLRKHRKSVTTFHWYHVEQMNTDYFILIDQHEQKEQLQWTMSGLSLPPKSSNKKKKSKFLLSKRFKEMVTVHKRRIIVYLNGQHTNCIEVVSDLKSMDDVSHRTFHLLPYLALFGSVIESQC